MIGIRTCPQAIHYPGMTGKYQWELFDLVKDPEEMNNLYHQPKHRDLREEMSERLRKLIREVGDPVHAPNLMKEVEKTRLIDRLKRSKQTVVAYGTSLTKVGAWVDQLRIVFNQQFPGRVGNRDRGERIRTGGGKPAGKSLKAQPDCVFINFPSMMR